LADGQAEGAAQFLREATPPLEISGENRIVTTEISRLRVGINVVELRLLRGVGPDQLRPERLVPRRVMALALLDGTQNMVERRARRLVRFSRAGFFDAAREAAKCACSSAVSARPSAATGTWRRAS
jgi:hypothetical protein